MSLKLNHLNGLHGRLLQQLADALAHPTREAAREGLVARLRHELAATESAIKLLTVDVDEVRAPSVTVKV